MASQTSPRLLHEPPMANPISLEFENCRRGARQTVAATMRPRPSSWILARGSVKDRLPYQPWAADLVKERSAQLGKDDPVGFCRPPGALRILTFPPPRKFIQLPGLVVILSERDVTYRQLFADGRPLPGDPNPSWNGYSTGKWEGDTFVVDTNGFQDGIWLDRKGSPMTDAARVTERFRRVNYGRLEIEVTVNDPKAYTRPWSITLNQRIVLNTELLDYFCLDNEKDAKHLVGK